MSRVPPRTGGVALPARGTGPIDAADALRRLIDGNRRFVGGAALQRPPTHDRLVDLAEAQHPFATILGCSDSRVSPEAVFDQGLGDLFIVRVAGNAIGTETLGSLGYALEHLATPLFVVLGHEGCGAVQAALQVRDHGATEHGKLAELLDAIIPALDGIDPAEPPDVQWQRAVEANVRWTVRRLGSAPRASAPLARGDIRIVGAVYELATGHVRFLPDQG